MPCRIRIERLHRWLSAAGARSLGSGGTVGRSDERAHRLERLTLCLWGCARGAVCCRVASANHRSMERGRTWRTSSHAQAGRIPITINHNIVEVPLMDTYMYDVCVRTSPSQARAQKPSLHTFPHSLLSRPMPRTYHIRPGRRFQMFQCDMIPLALSVKCPVCTPTVRARATSRLSLCRALASLCRPW